MERSPDSSPIQDSYVKRLREKTHVSLKLQRQHVFDIFFRIRRSVPLRHLKLAYCDRLGLDCDEVRFIYDGKKIGDTQTADQLEMEDGDIVECFSYQDGGRGGSGGGGSLRP